LAIDRMDNNKCAICKSNYYMISGFLCKFDESSLVIPEPGRDAIYSTLLLLMGYLVIIG